MKTLRYAIIIIILGAVVGFAANFARNLTNSGGLSLKLPWEDNRKFSGATEIPPSYQPGDSLLSLRDAHEIYAKGKAIFIDAREPGDYQEGHIKGAISFPFEHWDEYWGAIRPMLDSTREIVAYCGGLDCELSLFAARELQRLGYGKAYIFFGGWEKWKEAGLPIETSQPSPADSDGSEWIIPGLLGLFMLGALLLIITGRMTIRRSSLIFISRLILGMLFIYASFDKALNPFEFAKIIHNYRLMPPWIINIAAIILPWIELLAGILLIVGYKVRGANLIIGGLLVIYIIMLSITASRGINIACGCFSTSAAAKGNIYMRILEDIGMFLLFLHIFFFYKLKSRRFT